jgi:hypothetical protein
LRAGGTPAPQRRVIVINTSFRDAPWADVLYGCDAYWWDAYWQEARATCAGEFWTLDQRAADLWGVKHLVSFDLPGLSKRPGIIHQGGNSGYQAVNLAYLAGAKRIALLGYDMQDAPDGRRHHHADHPGTLNKRTNGASWIVRFAPLAAGLAAEGIEVINCTPGSALKCFPMAELTEVLACWQS